MAVTVDALKPGAVTTNMPNFASEMDKSWECPMCGQVYGLFVSGSYNYPLHLTAAADPCIGAINRALRSECPLGHPTGHFRSTDGAKAAIICEMA